MARRAGLPAFAWATAWQAARQAVHLHFLEALPPGLSPAY